MATYASLTAEQKADIAKYDTYLRGVLSSLTAIARQADTAAWNQFAVANVDPALALLGPSEVVPNSTGLGSAKDLTVSEFLTLQTIARGLVQTLADNRALLVKAAGVNVG